MTLAFSDVPNIAATTELPNIKPDASPSDDPRCSVCGNAIAWAGRGRRPIFCPDHRQKRSGAGQSTTAKNEGLAQQAAATLIQINGFVEMILRFSQMTLTADELGKRKDAFQDQLYQALLTDPDLCRTIMSGGGVSAKLALILAYGMLGSAVIPTGIVEFRARRALASETDNGEV